MSKPKKSAASTVIDTLLKKGVEALDMMNQVRAAAKFALMMNVSRAQFVDFIATAAGTIYDAEKYARDNPPPSPDGGSS